VIKEKKDGVIGSIVPIILVTTATAIIMPAIYKIYRFTPLKST
jgi:uncharacterized membrane protein YadS